LERKLLETSLKKIAEFRAIQQYLWSL